MKLSTRWVGTIAVVGLMISMAPARAGSLIDFETLPGDVIPVEGILISDQYLATHGMSFSLEGGGAPFLSQVGGTRATSFWGVPSHTSADNPAEGQPVGSFFITDDGWVNTNPPATFIVTYATLVGTIGGDIVDLDDGEGWRMEALDSEGAVLQSEIFDQFSEGAGDGLATPWSIKRLIDDIASVRIVYVGERTTYVGFSFDNFYWDLAPAISNPPAIPLPPAVWAGLTTMVGLVSVRALRRLRRA